MQASHREGGREEGKKEREWREGGREEWSRGKKGLSKEGNCLLPCIYFKTKICHIFLAFSQGAQRKVLDIMNTLKHCDATDRKTVRAGK